MSNENFLQEIWKEIPEFPYYKVSNFGNVVDNKGHNVLKRINDDRKCIGVLLYKYSSSYSCPYYKIIADLVAEAFVPKPKECNNKVFYKDKNWMNISADNLQWGTHKEKEIKPHIIDSKGNSFSSIKNFCSKYGISIRNAQNFMCGNFDKIKFPHLELLKELNPTYEL